MEPERARVVAVYRYAPYAFAFVVNATGTVGTLMLSIFRQEGTLSSPFLPAIFGCGCVFFGLQTLKVRQSRQAILLDDDKVLFRELSWKPSQDAIRLSDIQGFSVEEVSENLGSKALRIVMSNPDGCHDEKVRAVLSRDESGFLFMPGVGMTTPSLAEVSVALNDALLN